MSVGVIDAEIYGDYKCLVLVVQPMTCAQKVEIILPVVAEYTNGTYTIFSYTIFSYNTAHRRNESSVFILSVVADIPNTYYVQLEYRTRLPTLLKMLLNKNIRLVNGKKYIWRMLSYRKYLNFKVCWFIFCQRISSGLNLGLTYDTKITIINYTMLYMFRRKFNARSKIIFVYKIRFDYINNFIACTPHTRLIKLQIFQSGIPN